MASIYIVVPWFRLTLADLLLASEYFFHRFQTIFDRTQTELFATLELINKFNKM